MIKLIASDLDGTLLDGNHSLPIENVLAIRKIQEAGIEFMAATGRNYDSVKPLFHAYDLNCGYLLLNGALIVDEQACPMLEVPMDKHLVEKVANIFINNKTLFHLYTNKGIAALEPERLKQEFRERIKSNGNLSDVEVDLVIEQNNFFQCNVKIEDMSIFLNSEVHSDVCVYKMEGFLEDVACMKMVKEALCEHEEIAVTSSGQDNIEVTMQTAQKGHSLMHLCRVKNLHPDEVLVIGDSLNDLTMMEQFKHSVAMGNALDIIKEKATYITKSNLEYGVAHVLEQVLESIENKNLKITICN